MDATDSSLQGNKTGSIRHWWGQSVRSAGGVGTGSGFDAARDDGVRADGVRSGRSVEHEARSPECGVRNAVSGRPSREPPGRPAPSSSRCAFCTRGVHFALENDGWNCTFECEVHVSASGAPGGRRRDPCCPSRGPQRRRLSKSVAKARIEPERRKRNVDIPRFRPRPIPVRGAFATDLDTTSPRAVPGAPPAPLRARLPPSPRRSGPRDRRSRRERLIPIPGFFYPMVLRRIRGSVRVVVLEVVGTAVVPPCSESILGG